VFRFCLLTFLHPVCISTSGCSTAAACGVVSPPTQTRSPEAAANLILKRPLLTCYPREARRGRTCDDRNRAVRCRSQKTSRILTLSIATNGLSVDRSRHFRSVVKSWMHKGCGGWEPPAKAVPPGVRSSSTGRYSQRMVSCWRKSQVCGVNWRSFAVSSHHPAVMAIAQEARGNERWIRTRSS